MNNKNNEQNKIIVNNIRTLAATRGTNIATIERELGIGNGTSVRLAHRPVRPGRTVLVLHAGRPRFGVVLGKLYHFRGLTKMVVVQLMQRTNGVRIHRDFFRAASRCLRIP